jgi:hypothetical protein
MMRYALILLFGTICHFIRPVLVNSFSQDNRHTPSDTQLTALHLSFLSTIIVPHCSSDGCQYIRSGLLLRVTSCHSP